MDTVEAYRKKSVELITNRINSGAKRLSWVTTAGMGKTTKVIPKTYPLYRKVKCGTCGRQ